MDNIDWKYVLFDFDGRINRGKFWLGIGVVWAGVLITATIAALINSVIIWLLFGLLYLGTIWVGLALSIKRWHDRDKSGWWIFIAFIPIVGGLWALIETGFLEGTKGDNQYGPDPLAGT